ncbi:hypothetical protein BDU57DRAFT_518015 [Ampelomyces quisqualis]|uniref:Uncharacterized protein n=1 Tax=Ampelomyces quisqualis TaxID=50730 RepID=A0A6A5QK03_AMPQU|nr:hypothetical protein BDU57DRAFT_518015 [Ampelomyces quisqualis]
MWTIASFVFTWEAFCAQIPAPLFQYGVIEIWVSFHGDGVYRGIILQSSAGTTFHLLGVRTRKGTLSKEQARFEGVVAWTMKELTSLARM